MTQPGFTSAALPRRYFTATAMAAALLSWACRSGSSANSTRRSAISVLGLTLRQAEELRRDAVDPFTRQTGIQVDLIPTLGDSTEQLSQILRLLGQHASAPDVYLIDGVWPGALKRHLLDLSPYLDAEARDHLPELLRNNTVNGRLVCLPFYMNCGMLHYRRDLLEKYGYRNPPSTWAELEGMASRIQSGERAAGNTRFWGYVWQGAAYEGLTCNALEWQASYGGGRIVEPDGAITVRNQRAIEALRMAARWVGSISPKSVLNYTESDTLNVFRSGNAAFMRHWSRTDSLDDRSGLALLPAGSAGRAQTIGGFHFAVSRYSRHPQEAVQLVLYLTGSQVQLGRALRGGYLPTLGRLYNQPELIRRLPQLALLRAAKPESWVTRPSAVTGRRYPEVSRAYYQAVHNILSGKTVAEEALTALEKQLADLKGGDQWSE